MANEKLWCWFKQEYVEDCKYVESCPIQPCGPLEAFKKAARIAEKRAQVSKLNEI